MKHPPIPEVSPREQRRPRGLRCPHCQARFALTWSRYLRSPTGRHRCPECGAKSKLNLTLAHVASGLALGATMVLVAAALLFLLGRARLLVLAPPAIVADLVLILAVDRYLDERTRRLVPLRKPK